MSPAAAPLAWGWLGTALHVAWTATVGLVLRRPARPRPAAARASGARRAGRRSGGHVRWVRAPLPGMDFMRRLNRELIDAGEMVACEGLTPPVQARLVRAGAHGAVARRHDDFAAAEDAVQEALIAAAMQWPREGVPANPRGWLWSVALRRLADHVRGEIARRRREEAAVGEPWAEWAFVPPPDAAVDVEEDDTLALLFMCCHPALTPPSAIALTLRAARLADGER